MPSGFETVFSGHSRFALSMFDGAVTVFYEKTQMLREKRRSFGDRRLVLEASEEIDVTDSAKHRLGELLGRSELTRKMFAQLKVFAPTDIKLLITGKAGTDRELAGCAVHALSPRARGPFVVVKCGKLVPASAGTAFFGHAKAAFVGADRTVHGAFELAHRGTIFLDDIGELSRELQPLLLGVLDCGEIMRIGEHKRRVVDVRVVAATHRRLHGMVAAGTFRKDLYFRMVEGDIEMPAQERSKSKA